MHSSNPSASSSNNAVRFNRVYHTALATADLGAISFIDHTHGHNVSGNMVMANCVRHALGVKTQPGGSGALLTNIFAKALYLDGALLLLPPCAQPCPSLSCPPCPALRCTDGPPCLPLPCPPALRCMMVAVQCQTTQATCECTSTYSGTPARRGW